MAAKPSETQTYKKILVGYDGSENSERALERAIAMSGKEGSALVILVAVVTVVPMYGTAVPYYPPDYSERVTREGQNSLTEAINRAKQVTQDVSGSVVDGNAAENILNLAEKERVDLIVLGRRGLSGVQRFLMGSVSSSVVDHSKCDVLVVK